MIPCRFVPAVGTLIGQNACSRGMLTVSEFSRTCAQILTATTWRRPRKPMFPKQGQVGGLSCPQNVSTPAGQQDGGRWQIWTRSVLAPPFSAATLSLVASLLRLLQLKCELMFQSLGSVRPQHCNHPYWIQSITWRPSPISSALG